MYDVFFTIMKTDRGNHFVRTYNATKDAQRVWRDYCDYMQTSTRADLEVERLVSAITSKRLTSNYRGTTTKFVLEWLEDVRRYESITPTSSHFPDNMKKTMLQNAVNGIATFADIKNSEELDIAKGRRAIAYKDYMTLVQRIATSYDEKQARLARGPRYPRSVNEGHQYREMNEHNFYIEKEEDEMAFGDYDVNEHAIDNLNQQFGSFSVNEARGKFNRPYNRPSLRKVTWEKLSEEDRRVWDKMSDNGKRAIIWAHKHDADKNQTGIRSAQMHETVEVDIETEEPHQVTTDSQDYTTLLINSTKATGGQARMDLRQMMSEKKMIQDRKSKTDDKKKVKIDVSMANISYSVSVHESRGDGALVDRGANGGIAGANLRVIARTDRTVDINGLDNHQVRDLHIVTAGGVTTTQRGPIVAIFHQMAHSPMGRTIISFGQMNYFKIKVDDNSIRAGGRGAIPSYS